MKCSAASDFIICTGTRPAKPASVPFNPKTIFTSDGLLRLETLPKTIIVVGGGVIGVEYACMLATLGIKVTLVEGRDEVLGFLDHEITEAFQYQMRRMGITLRLGEKVAKIEEISPDHPEVRSAAAVPTATAVAAAANDPSVPPVAATPDSKPMVQYPTTLSQVALVQATLESGKHLRARRCSTRSAGRERLWRIDLEKVGLHADDRERLKVNALYQTEVEHIYAAGDVIGFPALASTAMEQGRLAACHAFDVPTNSMPELFPFGIYAIPEISMVGKTEEQLTHAGIPYEAGVAQYRELARGQLLGDMEGMLKLLIHQDDHTILGVHAIGTGATELIHIGQAVMAFKGTVDYFINNVFNYPTLAEAYKVAALNGLNKLRHV